MKCPDCAADNPDSNRFCGACGAALPLACPACGESNPPENRFCGACGSSLGAPDRGAAPDPRAAPGLPTAAGERRQATILFADLSGYTRLSAELDPEETHGLLNRFFEAVDAVVEGFGGTVDKHIGDSVMAVFGAPVAHGNDPERAVRAALEIHQAMPELGQALGRPIEVHIGIASGEVVASGVGSASHREYTVTGDSVNLASRLDDIAAPGETLISDAVRRATAALIECEEVREVTVRGLDGSPRVWRLKGLGRGGRDGEGLPFVGREAELRQFVGAVEACGESGRGQTIVVRGEAGIGKTRLVDEFRLLAEARGFASHRGLVLDFGVGKGQDAVRALVRSLLGLAPGSGENARRTAADGALATGLLGSDRRAFLNDLLDLPQPVDTRAIYDAMDSATRNRGKQETVAALVVAASARQPLLVTVEDVHWADDPTLAHLATIAATLAASPAILVMTSRVEGDPLHQAWRSAAGESPLMTVDLAPLREDEAAALAGGFTDATSRFARTCVERAGGNPLFLEQLLRGADETTEEGVPGSVQSIVLARMDSLEPGDREALQAASVIGKRFSLEALCHLIESPEYACAGLVEHVLVRPEGEDYLYSHALIQEGVYSSLLRTKARDLHRRAAAWFADRDPLLSAQHLDRADDAAAPRAYLEAAEAQASEYRYERALQLVERGLELVDEGGEKAVLTAERARLLRRLGHPKESIATYREALELAEREVDRCRAWIGIAAGVRLLGGHDEGIDAVDKAEPIARREGFDRELAQLHLYRGSFYFAAGDIDGCLEQQRLALEHAERAHDREWQARALGMLGDAYYARGRMRSALDHFRRCIALAREHGFGRIEVGNRFIVGVTRRYMNEFDAGLAEVRGALAMARQVGDSRTAMYALMLEGEFLLERGDPAGAEVPLAEGLEIADTIGNRRFKAYLLQHRARCRWQEGSPRQANEVLREALAISRETGLTFIGPRVLGVAALAATDRESREAALGQGEEILGRGCNAHNHLWFYRDAVEACLEGGDWDRAERYASALEHYTRAEALPWSDFFVARGRALAAHGRGSRDESTMGELRRLRDEADRVGLKVALPALESALAAA